MAAGFNLDRAIASSQDDDGSGKSSSGRGRGYVVEVLRVCPITPGQRIEDEPADSPFLARVGRAGSGAEDLFKAIRIQDPINRLIDVLLGGRGNAGQHLGRQGTKAPG